MCPFRYGKDVCVFSFQIGPLGAPLDGVFYASTPECAMVFDVVDAFVKERSLEIEATHGAGQSRMSAGSNGH